MIWKGREGYKARNGLTIYPWFLFILKLSRRFIFSAHKGLGWKLIIDLRRDHSMFRPVDIDGPTLVCRSCFVSAHYWVGPVPQPRSEWPKEFCSGKLYRWSAR